MCQVSYSSTRRFKLIVSKQTFEKSLEYRTMMTMRNRSFLSNHEHDMSPEYEWNSAQLSFKANFNVKAEWILTSLNTKHGTTFLSFDVTQDFYSSNPQWEAFSFRLWQKINTAYQQCSLSQMKWNFVNRQRSPLKRLSGLSWWWNSRGYSMKLFRTKTNQDRKFIFGVLGSQDDKRAFYAYRKV